jgi:hypothetical protein
VRTLELGLIHLAHRYLVTALHQLAVTRGLASEHSARGFRPSQLGLEPRGSIRVRLNFGYRRSKLTIITGNWSRGRRHALALEKS